MKLTNILIVIVTFFLSYNLFAKTPTILVLQITSDSGTPIAKINDTLKKNGIKYTIPTQLEIDSNMSAEAISGIKEEIYKHIIALDPDEGFITNIYGDKINQKKPCYKGPKNGVPLIYENVNDIFVDQSFVVEKVYLKFKNIVKFEYSEGGSSLTTMITINACKN